MDEEFDRSPAKNMLDVPESEPFSDFLMSPKIAMSPAPDLLFDMSFAATSSLPEYVDSSLSSDIEIPQGCESIKAELNGLNSLPRNQFTESAYKILAEKSGLILKNKEHRSASALILYRINFPGDYKSENLIDQIETAIRLKFENIQDIERLHKLIALRSVIVILIACRIILAYCPSHPIVKEYIAKTIVHEEKQDGVS